MRTIRIGDEKMNAVFTTWTAREFHRMTGVNLYDPSGITKVFRKYSDENESPTPEDFELIVKLAYCAVASAILPDNAPEDWKPEEFTWTGFMNKIKFNDPSVATDLFCVYFDRDIDTLVESAKDQAEVETKNA